jgi:uncharacterized protein
MGIMIPIMGNISNKTSQSQLLTNALFGKTRQAVLALLYGRTDSSFFTKQILDAVNTGRGAVQRELMNLTEAGIIIREVKARQVYYQANNNCPIFDELKNLVSKINSQTDSLEWVEESLINDRFKISRSILKNFCRRSRIRKLSLFGSVLRSDFNPESDIDVLVEFEPGCVPGFGIIDLENELSRLLKRKVDIRTPADLSRYFRSSVVREARVQYEQK